ncbi:MAG: pyruvate kinase [Planctomycetes bacterium]|nr:pyruvate kinase [Planctomycetota bacterium]
MRCLTPGEHLTNVKTKIIATVGPASSSRETLRELVTAGADIFRLNFAHGSYNWLAGVVATIRDISRELQRPIGILGDLSGPKIRLEELPGGILHCRSGEKYEFVRKADPAHPEWLTCTYEPLVDELQRGDRVLLADGTVSMYVAEKHADAGRVVCRVEQAGDIRSRQGINLPGVVLSTPSLTDKDREDLAWALENELDFIGLSFVRSATDIVLLRKVISSLNPRLTPQIVAKVEKMEAVDCLDQILDVTDAVMVARGDLGVEVDLAMVPIFQKRIIRMCNERRVPVITATQMLDSMTHNSRPTRAEANDVANAVLDGTDAVMLSGETAAGEYPAEAVATMSRICAEAERILVPHRAAGPSGGLAHSQALAVTEAVIRGAARAAEQLSAELIVVATRGGKTAMALSQQRSQTPILGVSDSIETTRRLCLYWGVTPLHSDLVNAPVQDLLKQVVNWCRANDILKSGQTIVLVTSTNWSADGHDLMLVHKLP